MVAPILGSVSVTTLKPMAGSMRGGQVHGSAVAGAFTAALLLAAWATAWIPGWWVETCLAAVACLAGAVFCACWRGATRWHWTLVVFTAPGLIGCLQLLAGASASVSSTEARIVRWAACGAVAVLAGNALGHRSRPRFLDAVAMGGAVLSGISVLQAFTSGGRVFWWFETPLETAFGPFLNRNHFAAFCEIVLPVAAWRAVEAPGWRIGLPASIALAGILSGSRAGAGLVMLEVVLLAAWAVSPRAGLSRVRSLGWISAALVGIPVVALAVGGDAFVERLKEAEPLLYRDQIWASAVELIRQKPWAGHGLGSFSWVYPSKAHFDTGEVVHRAHCDWLEWWVEGGGALPLLFFALLCWASRKTLQSPWLLGVPAVLLHSAVDYPLDKLSLLLLVAVLITVAAGVTAPQKRRRKPVPETEIFGPEPVHS